MILLRVQVVMLNNTRITLIHKYHKPLNSRTDWRKTLNCEQKFAKLFAIIVKFVASIKSSAICKLSFGKSVNFGKFI